MEPTENPRQPQGDQSLPGTHHYPIGPGKVVIFSQDKDRPETVEQVQKLTTLFQNLYGREFRVVDCRNFSKDEVTTILNNLREEEAKTDCYIMIIILAHGDSEKVYIFGPNKEVLEQVNIEYIKDCNGNLVPVHAFKDFLRNSYPRHFRGLPRVLVGQYCRGKKTNKVVEKTLDQADSKVDGKDEKTVSSGVPLDLDHPNNEKTIEIEFTVKGTDEVTKHGNWIFVHPTLPEHLAFRLPFIDAFCKAIGENPGLTFMHQMVKAQQEVVDNMAVINGKKLTQVGMIESTLSMDFYLGPENRINP